MLSFINQSVERFTNQHGTHPNLIYMSHDHFEQLRHELSPSLDIETLNRLLGMDIVLSHDHIHPQVAWSQHHLEFSKAS